MSRFWHSCPEHCVIPTSNRDWWLWKFETNRQRDDDTDRRLHDLGWASLRVWEHTGAEQAADLVVKELNRIRSR